MSGFVIIYIYVTDLVIAYNIYIVGMSVCVCDLIIYNNNIYRYIYMMS